MRLPNISVRLSPSLAIMIASVVLSYFTKVGWWSLAGLSFFLFALFLEAEERNAASVCLALFIASFCFRCVIYVLGLVLILSLQYLHVVKRYLEVYLVNCGRGFVRFRQVCQNSQNP